MSANRATLGGLPLEMHQDLGWTFVAGVRPHVREFLFRADVAEQVMELAGEPVTLEIAASDDSGSDLVVERLYVLESGPGPHPDIRAITVADGRIWWPWIWVERAYNVRRASGDKFLVGDSLETANIDDFDAYVEYSLDGEASLWDARTAVDDVLSAVAGLYSLDDVDSEGIPVEDRNVIGYGDQAVVIVGLALMAKPISVSACFRAAWRDAGEDVSVWAKA